MVYLHSLPAVGVDELHVGADLDPADLDVFSFSNGRNFYRGLRPTITNIHNASKSKIVRIYPVQFPT